jgi:hypothetical protein
MQKLVDLEQELRHFSTILTKIEKTRGKADPSISDQNPYHIP